MPARSAGLTQRAGSDCGIACRFSGVSIVVGSTQLTLMPCSRNSADIASVRRITADFDAYYAMQRHIDDVWRTPREWRRLCLLNIAGMAYFSSDRSIREYAEDIWNVPVG